MLAGINIFRVQDGKVVERWGRTDDLGFLQQLGIVPAMGTPHLAFSFLRHAGLSVF